MSEEELRLWQRAMRGTRMLDVRAKRSRAGETTSAAGASGGAPTPEPEKSAAPKHRAKSPLTAHSAGLPGSLRATAPALTPLHRRQARRIAAGRERIGARLDLHGLRQREAHHALRVFLHRAHAQGHQMVLVITGKGGRREEEAEGFFYGESPGVLRRLVPEWLREPEFREMVVSVSYAHVRHGGEGALYVRLRRGRARGKKG